VCLDRPLVPLRWPVFLRSTWDPVREFPVTGQLRVPGDEFPLDSAYAFRTSGLAELCDPGRFIREQRRERRDRRRNLQVSWSQVELSEIPTSTRMALYPLLPECWDEVERSTVMLVPLPPSSPRAAAV
jgi:hypothetical protein